MRISAKGRYGLAIMVEIANSNSERSTVVDIANRLGLSKIYLEQIFSSLRKAGLLNSSKGKQGGYSLAKNTEEITVYDILSNLEQTLFEPTLDSFSESKPVYDKTFEDLIYTPLDETVKDRLMSITLKELVNNVNENISQENYMYYI